MRASVGRAFQQSESERLKNLENAQNQPKTFDAQYTPDYLNQLKSGTDPNAPKLQENPFLRQVSELTTRDVNRALAARGGYDSGSSSEAIANALAPINYNAVQFATQGLQGLYQTGAQVAGNQANVTAGVIPTEASIYGGVGAGLNYSLYNGLVNKLNAQNSAGTIGNNNGFNVMGGNTSSGYVNAPSG